MIAATAEADPLSIVYLMVATLVSAGIIYAAFRNSIKHMVERVVDERVRTPIEKIHRRIDDHMREEEDQRRARDEVTNSTARDVAYLRGRLERAPGMGGPS